MLHNSLLLVSAALTAAAEITTQQPASAHGPGGSDGGHFVSQSIVAHNRFANHFRRKFAFHRVLVAPYGWGWSYDDYDTYANNVTIITYPLPAPLADAPTPSTCDRKTETFTVPSANGGTREIKVVSCP